MENMDKGLSTKMGANKLTGYPKCPKMYVPKLSVQTQKFGIFLKKSFFGRL